MSTSLVKMNNSIVKKENISLVNKQAADIINAILKEKFLTIDNDTDIISKKPPTLEEILKMDMNEIMNVKQKPYKYKESENYLNKLENLNYKPPEVNSFTRGGFLND